MKALTEGIGPLAIGALLPLFEGSALPGAPWLVCAASVGVSVALSCRLEAVISAHARACGGADTGYAVELRRPRDGEGSHSSDGSCTEVLETERLQPGSGARRDQ